MWRCLELTGYNLHFLKPAPGLQAAMLICICNCPQGVLAMGTTWVQPDGHALQAPLTDCVPRLMSSDQSSSQASAQRVQQRQGRLNGPRFQVPAALS